METKTLHAQPVWCGGRFSRTVLRRFMPAPMIGGGKHARQATRAASGQRPGIGSTKSGENKRRAS